MDWVPYFYIIEDVETKELYAGIKYGADANPNKFLTEGGYTTSSGEVNDRIKKNGLKRFSIRKITIMKNALYAQKYEHRFLWKVKAPSNPKFLNGNYGNTPNQKGKIWYTNGIENKLVYDCPEGFWKGKIQKSGKEHGHYGKKKNYKITPPPQKNSIWVTNGSQNKRLDLEEKIPEGFYKGRVVKKYKTKGTSTLKGRTWVLENGKRYWR